MYIDIVKVTLSKDNPICNTKGKFSVKQVFKLVDENGNHSFGCYTTQNAALNALSQHQKNYKNCVSS